MMDDTFHDGLREVGEFAQKCLADTGMRHHMFPFVGLQLSRWIKIFGIDVHLADIMDQCRQDQVRGVVLGEPAGKPQLR